MFQVGDIIVWKDGISPCSHLHDDDMSNFAVLHRRYNRPVFKIVAQDHYRDKDCFSIQDLEGGDVLPLSQYWLTEAAIKDQFLTAVHRVRGKAPQG